MEKNRVLDDVGERIVRFVRDDAIQALDQLLSGETKAPALQSLVQQLRACSDAERGLIREVGVEMIDTTLHNCMWLLEGGENLDLYMRDPDGVPLNISKLSDGLAGELYSEGGWIRRFSKYPPSRAS